MGGTRSVSAGKGERATGGRRSQLTAPVTGKNDKVRLQTNPTRRGSTSVAGSRTR